MKRDRYGRVIEATERELSYLYNHEPPKFVYNFEEYLSSCRSAGINIIRRPKKHKLKILPEYYDSVCDGSKTFEVRKKDRDFRVGDSIELREYSEKEKEYTGRNVDVSICYVLDDPVYCKDGYVIFGIKLIK